MRVWLLLLILINNQPHVIFSFVMLCNLNSDHVITEHCKLSVGACVCVYVCGYLYMCVLRLAGNQFRDVPRLFPEVNWNWLQHVTIMWFFEKDGKSPVSKIQCVPQNI